MKKRSVKEKKRGKVEERVAICEIRLKKKKNGSGGVKRLKQGSLMMGVGRKRVGPMDAGESGTSLVSFGCKRV